MSREIFIYWKLDESQVASAISKSLALQVELSQLHPGLQCRLHRRSDVRGGHVTLMESYRCTLGVDAALQAAIADAASQHLHDWATAPRHVEVFEWLSG